MRSRRTANDQVAEVARRRLEQLSAELAGLRLDDAGSVQGRPEVGAPAPPATRGLDDRGHRDSPARAATPGFPAGSAPGSTPGRHAHRSVGALGLVAGRVQDRLPAAVQGRVQMAGGHVAVVALLAVAGMAVTGWLVTRADGDESTVATVPSAPLPVGAAASSGPAPGSSSVPGLGAGDSSAGSSGTLAVTPGPAASAAPGTTGPPGTAPAGAGSVGTSGGIVVDVAGKVRRPGIATLPAGSRVVDALRAAGGPRRGARLGGLNLARVLIDGEQVVVGIPPPPGVAATAAAAPTSGSASGPTPLVNINTATQAELEELPGVGPVTARSILDFRAENGTFTGVDELLEVSGIGDATLAELAPFVTL